MGEPPTAPQTTPATLRLLDAIVVRSPNRLPRYRRAKSIEAMSYEKAHQKKLFLRLYRSTGNVAMSCGVIGRYERTVTGWRNEDAVFKESWDEITSLWLSILSNRFNSLGTKALTLVEELLDGEFTDDDLKAKLAQWILKSQGVGQDKAVLGVEHSGPGGGPIPVRQIVVHVTATPPALGGPAPHIEEGERVMEGEYTEVGSGDER